MGADYSFYVKTIETHARAFFKVIIFSIGSVRHELILGIFSRIFFSNSPIYFFYFFCFHLFTLWNDNACSSKPHHNLMNFFLSSPQIKEDSVVRLYDFQLALYGLFSILENLVKGHSLYQVSSKMLPGSKVITFILWHLKKYKFIMKVSMV